MTPTDINFNNSPIPLLINASIQLIQNIGTALQSVEKFLWRNPGYATSGIGIALGGRQVVQSALNLKQSIKIGDHEGQRSAGAELVSGTLSVNTSALSIANLTLVSTVSGVVIASYTFSGVGSIVTLAISGVGLYRCLKFNLRLSRLLAQEEGLSETDRLIRSLEFLQNQVKPTRDEKHALYESICQLHPALSNEQRDLLYSEQLNHLVIAKINHLKRRIGEKGTECVCKKIDQLLHNLHQDINQQQTLKAAHALISKVRSGIRKEVLPFALSAIMALIGLIALIVGIIFSFGTLPGLIGAISGSIAIAILAYRAVMKYIRHTNPAIRAIEMNPYFNRAEYTHSPPERVYTQAT